MAVPIDPGILTRIRAQKPRAAPNPLAGVLTNPLVVQADLARRQQIQDANAALRQSRSQALIQFGSPQLAQGYGDTVDPNTAAAAGANQFSTLANLSHQNKIGVRNILNNLAGHGLLHSGDLGYREGEQARAFGQASYDATQQLLAQLSGYLNQYLGSAQGANTNYTNQLLGAFGQYGQNPLGLLGG